jgi:hypothetical protein
MFVEGSLFRSFWMAHFYLVKKSTTVTGRNPSLSKHDLNTKCIVLAFFGGQMLHKMMTCSHTSRSSKLEDFLYEAANY